MSQAVRRAGYATRPAPSPPAPQLATPHRRVVRPAATGAGAASTSHR